MRKTKRNFKETPSNARANGWRQGWKAVGATSVAVLVVLGVVAMNPMSTGTVYAAVVADPGNESSLPSGAQIDLNSTKDVQSEVTLTMDAKPSGEDSMLNASAAATNPDESGKVIRRSATVSLTNTSGYTVNIKGKTTALTGTNASNTIPTVTAATTLGQMKNQWGWSGSVGDAVAECNPATTSFKSMGTSDQQLGTGTEIKGTANKKVTMCFGARIDGSKTADTYSNTVTLSVVAQPGKTATFGGITTMQAMTTSICQAADYNDTALLTDTRDNKKYWVTKLLDGNCWMSQNLDLDITTSNITAASSDVISDWTSGSTYSTRAVAGYLPRETTTDLTVGSTVNTETYSWDLGNYVINAPTATTACANNATGLASCTMFTDVTGWTASDDPNFYKNNGGSSVNATTKTYDAHYLVGNYYQWNAATAGMGGTITTANATSSICPKGWNLPSSGDSASKSTFGYMLLRYGINSNVIGTSNVNGYAYNIALSPLFLMRGGRISPANTSTPFQDSGAYGSYWSSRATSNALYSYRLLFGTDVYSSNDSNRYFGFSLRCLVPTP